MFAELKDPVRRKIDRYELTSTIDPSHFFPTFEAAIAAFQGKRGRSGARRRRRKRPEGLYQDARVGCWAGSPRTLRSSASSNSSGNR